MLSEISKLYLRETQKIVLNTWNFSIDADNNWFTATVSSLFPDSEAQLPSQHGTHEGTHTALECGPTTQQRP